MADSSGQFVNDYNVYETHTLSSYYHDQWNAMDFRVAGFDPDIDTKYARFIININGIENFILGGGSSQEPQPRPITLTGNLKIKGTITGTSSINRLEFIAPGDKVDNPQQAASLNELPLYNNKPGVFNLVQIPEVNASAWGKCRDSGPYP